MNNVTRPTLSVVVVTRNEADNIEDCLDSVIELCRDGPPFEILLVDSNSTDETVQLATEFPATVLRIPDDDLASPGAGRYVGTKHARGAYILFVDGDISVENGWLDDALDLVQRPSTAGVTGHLNQVPRDTPTTATGAATEPAVTSSVSTASDSADPGTSAKAPTPSTMSDGGVTHLSTATSRRGARDEREIRDVDALRGVALYDADVLDEVGGFDPHLQASEDVDVGYRLRSEGYHLVRLPYVVASHPTSGSLSEPIRRWRSGYFHGVGQSVRKGADDPSVMASHLLALRHPLLGAAWGGLGLVLGARSRRALAGWALFTTIALGVYSSRSDARTTIYHASSYTLTLLGLVLGWRRPPPPPEVYPIDRVEVVQSGPILS